MRIAEASAARSIRTPIGAARMPKNSNEPRNAGIVGRKISGTASASVRHAVAVVTNATSEDELEE